MLVSICLSSFVSLSVAVVFHFVPSVTWTRGLFSFFFFSPNPLQNAYQEWLIHSCEIDDYGKIMFALRFII